MFNALSHSHRAYLNMPVETSRTAFSPARGSNAIRSSPKLRTSPIMGVRSILGSRNRNGNTGTGTRTGALAVSVAGAGAVASAGVGVGANVSVCSAGRWPDLNALNGGNRSERIDSPTASIGSSSNSGAGAGISALNKRLHSDYKAWLNAEAQRQGMSTPSPASSMTTFVPPLPLQPPPPPPPPAQSPPLSSFGDKELDSEPIRMFVGQVPKNMDEAQLRELFEQFGPVHTVNVLRDRNTGISRGCCFVTYCTRRAALKAQEALHNLKTLPGMGHPLQMKPADTEKRNDRKLFVGMLSKRFDEADVRSLFESYGLIEECTVLRDPNGVSRGCAFITFASRQSAITAINAIAGHNKIMDGCSSPLVVKFADTPKEKELKKHSQLSLSSFGMLGTPITRKGPIPVPVAPTILTSSTPTLVSPTLSNEALVASNTMQVLQAASLREQYLNGMSAQLANSNANAAVAAAGLLQPCAMQNLAAYAALTQPNALVQNTAHIAGAAALLCLLGRNGNPEQDTNPLTSAYMTSAAPAPSLTPIDIGVGGSGSLSLATVALSSMAAAAAGKQNEGPPGANLFIYHLPQDFNDTDLASLFLPFGHVISAKVFIDKHTNLSKCFGFVSFNNVQSAEVAIDSMNGFQVGLKRLKVQLKKPREPTGPPMMFSRAQNLEEFYRLI